MYVAKTGQVLRRITFAVNSADDQKAQWTHYYFRTAGSVVD